MRKKKTEPTSSSHAAEHQAYHAVLNDLGIQGGYLFPPLGIEDGKVKFSFLGSEKQIKEFMEKLDAIAIHYRVVLLADANFSPISPLSQLTEKQQEVLLTAYKMGYYDIPRKITSQQIADKLKIAGFHSG